MIPRNAIAPETIATKLARAGTLEDGDLARVITENPRVVEMMWFVQWRSCEAGGLQKLVEDMLAVLPHRFVTSSMLECAPRQGRYSLAQCFKVWRDFRTRYDRHWPSDVDEPGTFESFLARDCHSELTLKQAEQSDVIKKGVERFNWEFLNTECQGEAYSDLCGVLKKFATRPDGWFYAPWYCPDLVNMLGEFMDHHASQVRTRIATTAVVTKVFDAVDYAWSEKKLVRLNGNSRFGKTEALKTYAEMHPGRVRLVTAPALGNSNQDLVYAVAKAFGFPALQSTTGPALRRKVEFVLEHGHVGILMDEAHSLFPFELGRNTAPARLNWLRAAVVDKGLPCVLSATPQNFDGQSERFERATKFNMDQFTGRVSMTRNLPDELDSADLKAVVRIHLPRLSGPLVELVSGAALQSQSFLKAVEDIASLARHHARSRAVPEPALEDFKAAIEEAVPVTAALFRGTMTPPRETAAPAPRAPRKRAAEVIQELRPGASRTISQPDPHRRHDGELVAT